MMVFLDPDDESVLRLYPDGICYTPDGVPYVDLEAVPPVGSQIIGSEVTFIRFRYIKDFSGFYPFLRLR